MARPMRRQLASFSSNERTLVMAVRWAGRRPFSTRFLRTSDNGFTRQAQCRSQGSCELCPHLRRQECANLDGFSVAAERQLAPMVPRLVHMHPNPVGVEAD